MFNKTKTAEINHLKNRESVLLRSIEDLKQTHSSQLLKLDEEINSLKETIKRWQFENELLSEQYKSITTEMSNFERLVI